MCSRASSWALTKEYCSFPWVTQTPGQGSSKTPQCQGVDQHLVCTKAQSHQSPEGDYNLVCSPHCTSRPCFAFIIAQLDGSPSSLSSFLSDPIGNLHNSQIVETGKYKKSIPELRHILALAITWLHLLLTKLLHKVTSKPSYRSLQ